MSGLTLENFKKFTLIRCWPYNYLNLGLLSSILNQVYFMSYLFCITCLNQIILFTQYNGFCFLEYASFVSQLNTSLNFEMEGYLILGQRVKAKWFTQTQEMSHVSYTLGLSFLGTELCLLCPFIHVTRDSLVVVQGSLSFLVISLSLYNLS